MRIKNAFLMVTVLNGFQPIYYKHKETILVPTPMNALIKNEVSSSTPIGPELGEMLPLPLMLPKMEE